MIHDHERGGLRISARMHVISIRIFELLIVMARARDSRNTHTISSFSKSRLLYETVLTHLWNFKMLLLLLKRSPELATAEWCLRSWNYYY